MKKLISLLLGLVLVMAASAYLYLQPATAPEHQVFINGQVLTLDDSNTVVEAVALEHNRIIATGSTDEITQLINDDTVVHDLKGRTLIPGFIDAHGHFPGSGLFRVTADLRSPPMGKVTSIDQLMERLRHQLQDKEAGQWVVGSGYDDTLLAEKRHPTRAELDAISTEHPIYITHTSGHMGVANSAALKIIGYNADTPNPVGGVIVKDPATGELTGLLEETAHKPAYEHAANFSNGELVELLQSAIDDYTAAGVTLAQSGGVFPEMLKGLSLASKLGFIPIRMELWPFYDYLAEDILSGAISPSDYESELTRVGNIKIVADGSIQGFTGYLSQPYHTHFRGDANYRGYPSVPRDLLVEQVDKLHQAGLRIAIHGNGDAAIDDIIYAFEQAQHKYPNQDPRLILIHSQMAREDQLVKMKQLGITPSFFSAHTYYWGDRHRDIFMGPERAFRMSPTASAEALGLKFSVHMDTPIAPMEPLTLIWSTVNRVSTGGQAIGEEQRISALSALRATTIDAAYQIFRDHELGSIEPGKLADLVILDKNPLEVAPMALRDIQVEQTLVNGVTVFKK